MGKDSLIKSTSKKNENQKESAQKAVAKSTKKTTAARTTKAKKPAAKTAAKAATKSKTTPKATAKAPAKSKATRKTGSQTTKKAAVPKKKTAARKVKKLTVKELRLQKFEPMQPPAAASTAPRPRAVPPSSPPLITSTDPKEVARIRAILSEKFSMAEVKAAARKPAPVAAPEKSVRPAAQPEPGGPPPAEPEPQGAAEKPAAQIAQESACITTPAPQWDAAPDPVTRAAKIAIGLAAAVVILLLGISYHNSTQYYIFPQDNAIEIWKGRFSPKDNRFYMVLHGTEFTDAVKAVYSRKEVFPLIFSYYLDKADTLLEVPGLPNFDAIKNYLHQAQAYTVTPGMDTAVNSRLNTIERMILLYKADVAISKGTVDSLEAAIKWLQQAGRLNPSAMQAEEIGTKIKAAGEAIAAIKTGGAAKAAEKE